MGRGNVCVCGKYEGLYYVDRDYLDCYIAKELNEYDEYEQKMLGELTTEDFNNYDYDYTMSEIYYEEFIIEFIHRMKKKFNSLESTDKDYGVIMENNLFEIVIEDNEWSYAVELIQKEDSYYNDYSLKGLQKKHYKSYLDGIKTILLELFPSIGCYGGAWTHGTITREDLLND